MKNLIIFVAFSLILIGCQNESPVDIFSDSPDLLTESLAKKTAPDGFVIHEPGFEANLLASDLTTPEGFDIFGNGVIYLVQAYIGIITQVNPSGIASTIAQIPFTEPNEVLIDLIIDPARGMFVTMIREGKIQNVTFNGQISEFASGLNRPLSMSFDSDKNLYVAEYGAISGGAQITRFDKQGNRTVIVEFDDFNRPKSIVFDENDRLYVASNFDGEIRRFDVMAAPSFPMPLSSGIVIATLSEHGVSTPVNPEITFGFDGDLFVVSRTDIFRLKLDGNVTLFASGLRGGYNAIEATASGNLLVSDSGNQAESNGRIIKIKD